MNLLVAVPIVASVPIIGIVAGQPTINNKHIINRYFIFILYTGYLTIAPRGKGESPSITN